MFLSKFFFSHFGPRKSEIICKDNDGNKLSKKIIFSYYLYGYICISNYYIQFIVKNCFFSVIWKQFFFLPSVLFFIKLWLLSVDYSMYRELYVHKILCMIESTSGSIKKCIMNIFIHYCEKNCINVISVCDKLLFIHNLDTLCCQFILCDFRGNLINLKISDRNVLIGIWHNLSEDLLIIDW